MDSPAPTSCNFGSDPFIRFLPIACFLPDMGTAFPDRLSRPPGDGSGCRKSGLRHFFEVFIAPLRLRRGQGAMQGNPCYARLFADLTRMSPNPIKASGGCGPRTPGGFSTGCFVVFTKKMVRVFRQPNHKAQNKNRIAKGKAALFYPGKTHPRGNGDV